MYLSCATAKVFDLITTGSVTVAKAEENGNKRDIWDAQEEAQKHSPNFSN